MYSRYLLRRTRQNTPITIRCRTKTADFYGWSNHFPIYRAGCLSAPDAGTQVLYAPHFRRGNARAGRSILISRSQSKNRGLATYCNYFRISGDATIADLAKVAKFTDVDWNWMETPSGERRSREKWLSLHDAWTQGGGG